MEGAPQLGNLGSQGVSFGGGPIDWPLFGTRKGSGFLCQESPRRMRQPKQQATVFRMVGGGRPTLPFFRPHCCPSTRLDLGSTRSVGQLLITGGLTLQLEHLQIHL